MTEAVVVGLSDCENRSLFLLEKPRSDLARGLCMCPALTFSTTVSLPGHGQTDRQVGRGSICPLYHFVLGEKREENEKPEGSVY